MRALSLQRTNVAQGEQQQVTCGRSLSANYVPLCLENKLLAQASTLMPQPRSPLLSFSAQPSSCPSLQPSSLSSTSSSLLSTSLTSPLLSTENKLLTDHSPGLSFSLTSSTSVPNDALLFTSLANRFAHPPSFLHRALGGGDGGGDEGSNETSEVMQSSFEETSEYSEGDNTFTEEEEDVDDDDDDDDDDGIAMEIPAQETELGNNELEQTMAINQEEFAEIDRANENVEEELKDKKYLLLNVVCCSLVNKSTAPGQKDWDSKESVWTKIIELAKDISVCDPQFLLKVAVYTRQELNIRITANFLLALAANQPSTKPHVRRYFCAAVQLPSDWLEVVRIYSTCFSRSLPMCLKKAMADKFKQFNEYQLAKYNTRKHRCKHNRNKRKPKRPTSQQMKKWANLLRSDESILTKFLQEDGRKGAVDKKQSEFSIKKMIKKFHIKEPAEHVMAILGKKYPADLKTFTHSGIKGTWDRERAGKRMKLKEPETWERLLSLEGNKAATWEKLIDNKSLPFMAMLRNLRNMITKGISEAHHKMILSRLTNKKAVIQSRQFPTRFLAAYKVIMELNTLAAASEQALPSVKEILKSILSKIPKSKRFKRLEWETTPRNRIRVTLGVPFIYRLYQAKKTQLLKANQKEFTVALLERYRTALETAVQLSCRYNVPPLPGRTVIVLSSRLTDDDDWSRKLDFCLPPDPEQKKEEEEEEKEEEEEEKEEEEKEKEEEQEDEEEQDEEDEEEQKPRGRGKSKSEDQLTPSMKEVAILLSLMIGSSAEDFQLCLQDWCHCQEAELKSDVLLDNVRSVMKQMKACSETYENRDQRGLSKMLTKKNKVDNIIVLSDRWIPGEVEWIINTYRRDINNNALVVKILLNEQESEFVADRNCVKLCGFSEQMLRFVAERGSSRMLDHVEHLDKVYNVPPPQGAKDPQATNSVVPIPASPKLRWRGVRVFISSTFRDMHAERDVLVQSVFPELRRRAASHCLYLQEVELRWGVTEEESGRATELCLSEVCRCQMLVGLLGERYGLVPPRPVLPDLPQNSWLVSAPEGLSITEMEIRQFQALYPDTAQQRMFCYFRDPNIIKSVPVAWRSHFVPESKEAESKMASLKTRIRDSEVKVTENYSCAWGGVEEGRPYLKHLEDFGKAVLEDLWTAVGKLFVEEHDEAEALSDVMEQEVHQEALQRQFFGRAKLLSGAVEIVEQAQSKGGLMVVEGGPGEGKTVFMAALADSLRTGVKSRKNLVCDVTSYSTAASQSARSVENLLRFLVQWLRKMKDTKEESPLPHSYKDLLLEFHSNLSDIKKNKPLVLLIDGVDLLQDGRGQLSSDWIPQQLPQGVCLVVSITTKAALLQTLAKKSSTVLFAVGQLTMPDRKEIVQKGLDSFGKKLSDSAFNNQLQTLIMKKGAVSPLYLHLACEDLRNFASFDKLKESLQGLPQSLSQLVQHSLDRLCSQYRGMLGLRWALAALTVSSTGLREGDLYSVLNTCNDLSSRDGQVTWQEVLHLSRKPKGRIPMATFTRIAQSLQSLVGPSHCHDTDDLLALTNPEVRRAFEDFLLPTESDRTRAHLVLAAHLWALADPQGTDTFLHCEANSVMHLPSSLIQSGQLEQLQSLLSSYYFLYANVRQGLLHHLKETYSLCDNKNQSAPSFGHQDRLEDCQSFLRRHGPLLSSWPALFVQQALNEPPETSAHTWAQGLMGKGGARVVEWLNNDSELLKESNELVSTFSSVPTCLVGSSDEELVVVGTGQGMLHFINTQTGQEVKTLVSSCDGISSGVFLKDGRLATTSFDGRIEIWDVENGCRTALIEGHTNVITASDITADRKHLATVSLDFMLKVWSSTKSYEVAALPSSSPLNCVTFDPEGHLLAAGCWNGNVIVWNWLQNKTLTSLTGHRRSVRSLCFSPSSSMLCSGSLCGEVRVWSVPTSTCVGCFQAHCGATEALTFLDEGSVLLSAGSDHVMQLWSGGLGRLVTALKSDECEQEPPRKKLKSVTCEPAAALCVAVNGDYAAVGYHGDGIKLFSLDSGEKIWDSTDLDVSILSLLWVVLDAEQTEPELLLSAGSDKRVRVWKKDDEEKGLLGGLKMWGMFNVQPGTIQTLAQNSTYLATASDNFSIALCLLSDLALDPSIEHHDYLRGHSGGVTCLAFSPDGRRLLSGGKDKALMVWDVSSSPAVLSKSLLHSHKDWITGCVWTPDCVISCSSDGKLCLWDLEAGKRLGEISLGNPLTSICCLGRYVMAGSAEGALHVWNWETKVEICHIAAHTKSIHHCSLLPNTDLNKEVNPEEMTVITASEDGTVQLWKPLQVEHFGTLQGHSGAICGVVCKEGLPEFLTVSEDCTLRCWTGAPETPASLRGPVTALCFSRRDALLLAGYESGLLEVWQHNALVGQKQASDGAVTAICSMPDDQFAVSYTKLVVDVWKLVWNQQHSAASLVKVTTHPAKYPVVRLDYCSILMGVSDVGVIFDITKNDEKDWEYEVRSWEQSCRILGMTRNDEKSLWLVGEGDGHVTIGFIFAMGPKSNLSRAFSSMDVEINEEGEKGIPLTAGAVDKEFVVCGDVKGNMLFNKPPDVSSWSSRKPAHSDRISVLKLTERTIISASYDRTVKLWDRNTKKQVGMFACGGPVLHLEVNPANPTQLVCGDGQGQLYFLSWKE
ncbi:telomerase protein component 1 isoform X2 [Cebidichthys violaceus]|uniref:telomerase protein component 1 isoform X2 n=1 Tax=Cebidichthys violaceus TaxID=271503 RepID=UPI0035CB938B